MSEPAVRLYTAEDAPEHDPDPSWADFGPVVSCHGVRCGSATTCWWMVQLTCRGA